MACKSGNGFFLHSKATFLLCTYVATENAVLVKSQSLVVPMAVPSLVVTYDDTHVSVPPFVLPIWEKMLLEPYSGPRHVKYVALAPDNPFLISQMAAFLRDMSSTYQVCWCCLASDGLFALPEYGLCFSLR